MCCAASDALGGQKECDLCVSTDEKIHLYLRISGVVQRDSLVGLAPGHSGSLIPSHSAVLERLGPLFWIISLFQGKAPVLLSLDLQVAKFGSSSFWQ